ncbi:MAG: HEAT repeat domain-containing protein [bacterium]
MQKKAVSFILLFVLMSGINFPVFSEEKEPVDQKTEILEAIKTLKQAIADNNDPMRNKMYFKFRLIEQDTPGVVAPYLIANLNDEAAGVSEYIAFILGWIEDKRAIQPLRELLTKKDSQKIAAARALGFMRAEESIPDIVALLEDTNPRVRGDAAYSLGLMGNDKANAALQKATQDDDELVRYFAQEALQRIEDYKKFGW